MLTGSCNCGRFVIEVAQPRITSICHCRTCRKFSGSTMTVGFMSSVNKTTITGGEPSKWTSRGESSQDVTRHFCPECGSCLYTLNETFPTLYFIAGGLFEPGSLPPPQREAYLCNLEKWQVKYENVHYSLDDNGGF